MRLAMPSPWLAIGAETDPLKRARQLQGSWERTRGGHVRARPSTFGAIVVGALADLVHGAGAVFDVHLMIERPERQIARTGADNITIHVEATPQVH